MGGGGGYGALRLFRRAWSAGAVLLLVGVLTLAVPFRGPRSDVDCGSVLVPREPTAAQVWDDVDAVEAALGDCPGIRRTRLFLGGPAAAGGVALLVIGVLRRGRGRGDEG